MIPDIFKLSYKIYVILFKSITFYLTYVDILDITLIQLSRRKLLDDKDINGNIRRILNWIIQK
jgi:hypothetical protein